MRFSIYLNSRVFVMVHMCEINANDVLYLFYEARNEITYISVLIGALLASSIRVLKLAGELASWRDKVSCMYFI